MKTTNIHHFATRTARAAMLALALACSAAPAFAAAITDNFDDGNDNGWFRVHPFGQFGVSNSFQVINGEYVMAAGPSPAPQILPATVAALPNFGQFNWTDFEVSVDFSGWATGNGTNQGIVLGGRGSANADGSFNFYGLQIVPDDFPQIASTNPFNATASVSLTLTISNASVASFAFLDLPAQLISTQWYRAVFVGKGNLFIGRLYQRDNLAAPIAEVWGYDLNPRLPSGFVGLVSSDRAASLGFGNNGARVRFDNFYASDVISVASIRLPVPTNSFLITDNFDDGNDAGWTRVNPFGNATFATSNGVYRLAAPPSPAPALLPAVAMAVQPVDWADFTLSVDFSGWLFSPTNDTFIMLNARQSQNLDGTFNFYSLRVVPNTHSPSIPGLTPNALVAIDAWTNNVRLTLYAPFIPNLDPTRWYRLVFIGRDNTLEGRLYSVTNLDVPLVAFSAPAFPDARLQHGAVSLMALDRLGHGGVGNGAISVLFDNFAAWGLELPPPLTVERAVILSWPAGDTNVFLQAAAKVTGSWSNLTVTPTVEGNANVVALRTSANMQYFRLVRQ